MWLGLIIGILLLVLFIVLFTSFEIEIDTENWEVLFRWGKIGAVCMWYDDTVKIRLKVLFYKKIVTPSFFTNRSNGGRKKTLTLKSKNKATGKRVLTRIIRIINSFKVVAWNLAIDTGDNILNARLFPLNFIPMSYNHVNINFLNKNFLYIKVRNNVWKIIKAYFLTN